jgi:hypothetical protein
MGQYEGTFGGSTYQVITGGVTFSQARTNAAAAGGHLAIITSAEEDNFIYSLLVTANISTTASDGGGVPYAWIGGTDESVEGLWIWVDGTDFSYTNWGSGSLGSEPDDYEEQDYAAIGLSSWPSGMVGYGEASQWNDVDGSNMLAYVIETTDDPEPIIETPVITSLANSFIGFQDFGTPGINGHFGESGVIDTVYYDLSKFDVSFSFHTSSAWYSGKYGYSEDFTVTNLRITGSVTTYGSKSGSQTITDSETLSNIERLYFTDKAYALDLDGNAGIAAKAIIATFGASDLSTYMKAALSIVDNGTTLDELCDLVISGGYIESSAGGTDMSSFVEYVYGNVVGRELNAFEQISMTGAATGGLTKAELLKLAVRLDDVASQITTNAIDLIGVPGSSDGEQLVISFDI